MQKNRWVAPHLNFRYIKQCNYLYKINYTMHNKFIEFFGYSQQKFELNVLEFKLLDSDPVYTILEVLEQLDFTQR